mmetsp:Transcript_34749/g.87964  ORF Transcript_34749/g.87964 Transcript_34749/m.87964 type:complete len:325 (-) Transcript_34749:827-1801(-)
MRRGTPKNVATCTTSASCSTGRPSTPSSQYTWRSSAATPAALTPSGAASTAAPASRMPLVERARNRSQRACSTAWCAGSRHTASPPSSPPGLLPCSSQSGTPRARRAAASPRYPCSASVPCGPDLCLLKLPSWSPPLLPAAPPSPPPPGEPPTSMGSAIPLVVAGVPVCMSASWSEGPAGDASTCAQEQAAPLPPGCCWRLARWARSVAQVGGGTVTWPAAASSSSSMLTTMSASRGTSSSLKRTCEMTRCVTRPSGATVTRRRSESTGARMRPPPGLSSRIMSCRRASGHMAPTCTLSYAPAWRALGTNTLRASTATPHAASA